MGYLLDQLIGWSIRNRAVVLLLALALAVAGIWSAVHPSLDVLPPFLPPEVVVQTQALGMSTADIEEIVTRPLERNLLGTANVTSVRSTSSPGLSVVSLTFEEGTDIYRARQLVEERIELIRGHLSQGVEEPKLAPISAPIGAALKLCLTSQNPDEEQALRELRTFADWKLRPRLASIPGVAQITVYGGEVERLEVRPDPGRLRARGFAMPDVVRAVRQSQAILGAGFVDVGEARLDVRHESKLSLADAVSRIAGTVVADRDGLPVLVGDVAQIVRGDAPRVGAALYDGQRAVYVQVNKLPWTDTIEVTRSLEAALRESEKDLPAGARIEPPVFRQADFVHRSIRSVGRAMLLGSVFVIAMLILFLRSPRLAAISLTAIPLSILAAVLVLVARGVSINGMTLGGLAIAVGEVVDDAIVDVENIWRRLRENTGLAAPRPALEVIRDASREVRGAVVYATLIVGLVLVPVLLLPGIAGRIFSPLAEAYLLAIAASLVVALTVTPALCAFLLPRIARPEARLPGFAERLSERYDRLVRRAVERPRTVFALAGGAVAVAVVTLPFLGGRFLPEFQEDSLIAEVQTVPGISLDEATRLAKRADSQIRPQVAEHVATRIGRAELDEDAAPINRIEMTIRLRPEDRREREEVALDLTRRIGQIPGLRVAVEGFLAERVDEILSGEVSPVVVKVFGPDLDELRRLTSEIAAIMDKTPGLSDSHMEPQIDVPQIRLRPDAQALARFGITPGDLADQVNLWREGTEATEILEPSGRSVDVTVVGGPAWRRLDALKDISVSTTSGGVTNLSALAAIDELPAPSLLKHEGGERRISIGARAGSGLSRAVASLESRVRREVRLPHGYRIEVGGESVARREAAGRLLLVGGLVLLAIFVLLASAFGSLTDAGIVLANLPLGLVGGVLAALVVPGGLSVAGLVGFVTLFGIISRNGIMLVAHKRNLDVACADQSAVERVLRAARERLLPILMTASTAGLGLLPLAFSFGAGGSELEAPMAMIVCGGLVTSTALNMLVLPTFYVWLERRHSAADLPGEPEGDGP